MGVYEIDHLFSISSLEIEAVYRISLTTTLHAPLTLALKSDCWSEIINIYVSRAKLSICFLN